MSTSKDLDELESLLRNWGRWSRAGETPHSVSNLYPLLQRLRLFGHQALDEDEYTPQEEQGKPIDEIEALRVNDVITRLPSKHWGDAQGKRLLIFVYLYPWKKFPEACYRCRLTQAQGEILLERVKMRLKIMLNCG